MKFTAALIFLGIFGRLFGSSNEDALRLLDDHLTRWDRFARGENDLAPSLGKARSEFETRLSAVLRADPKHGVPRLVYYAVLQVGSFFPVDSELGKEVVRVSDSLPVYVDEKKNGERSIFGGYVYLWWREHKMDYARYQPLEEWEKREFSRKFIQMYESMRAKNKG